MKMINKIKTILTLFKDFRKIDNVLMSYIGDKEKSLIKAREELYMTIETLLKELNSIDTIKSKEVIKEFESEYENSPNVIYIRDDKGIYRTYNKINYFTRNIIYASYGYGIDLKNFTYGELLHAINNKEVFEK